MNTVHHHIIVKQLCHCVKLKRLSVMPLANMGQKKWEVRKDQAFLTFYKCQDCDIYCTMSSFVIFDSLCKHLWLKIICWQSTHNFVVRVFRIGPFYFQVRLANLMSIYHFHWTIANTLQYLCCSGFPAQVCKHIILALSSLIWTRNHSALFGYLGQYLLTCAVASSAFWHTTQLMISHMYHGKK